MLLATLTLTACGTNGQGSSQAFCTAAKPIYFDKSDKVSKTTERAIIAHNEVGAKLCQWKPPAK
jgi:hypothetical protein